MNSERIARWRRWAVAFVFIWFVLGGLAHFLETEAEVRVVPPFIPMPGKAVLFSGVFELLGAAGLLWRRSRNAAAVGLFILTIAVTPVHIYMLQRPELFDVPFWALVLRLPLQILLLALIAWIAAGPWPDRGATGRK